MENKILVIYVSIAGVRSEDIDSHVKKVTNKIIPNTFEGEIIVLPTQYETRIECINPKYITDVELINEHTELLKKIKEELKNQLEQLNNKK